MLSVPHKFCVSSNFCKLIFKPKFYLCILVLLSGSFKKNPSSILYLGTFSQSSKTKL